MMSMKEKQILRFATWETDGTQAFVSKVMTNVNESYW
jgi:hypothetical protein